VDRAERGADRVFQDIGTGLLPHQGQRIEPILDEVKLWDGDALLPAERRRTFAGNLDGQGSARGGKQRPAFREQAVGPRLVSPINPHRNDEVGQELPEDGQRRGVVAVKPSGADGLGAVVSVVAGEVAADLRAVFLEDLKDGVGKGS